MDSIILAENQDLPLGCIFGKGQVAERQFRKVIGHRQIVQLNQQLSISRPEKYTATGTSRGVIPSSVCPFPTGFARYGMKVETRLRRCRDDLS
jgi:hypothetical protein